MGNIQFAKFTEHRCPMSDPVCAAKVIEHLQNFRCRDGNGTPTDLTKFVEEKCGRYVKGKNKGLLRGWATIRVCTVGGWEVLGPGAGNGRVCYPGKIYRVTIADFNGTPYWDEGI